MFDKKTKCSVLLVTVIIGVVLFMFVMLYSIQKVKNRSVTEEKYSEYITFEPTGTEKQTSSDVEEVTTVNENCTEETTKSVVDYLNEMESKKADGTYETPEVETYDYSLLYELFPYHITLGLYKEDIVLNFFSDDKYFQYKEDMGELGIYTLEALYNICKMYDYSPEEFEKVTPTVFTDDSSVTFNYKTPGGLLILVVDTIGAQAYFTMGE